MSDDKAKRRQSVLDPIERSSEVLFGLIMVLSFTLSISIAETDRDLCCVVDSGADAWREIQAFYAVRPVAVPPGPLTDR